MTVTSAYVSVILLAGGVGSRMEQATPKQFLPLNGKVIARYSFDLFLSLKCIKEIVVVCAMEYRHLFSCSAVGTTVRFAEPGARRQDSVYSGLQEISQDAHLVCIHDSARPLITKAVIEKALMAAEEYGAAVVGVPMKMTVKESDASGMVKHTFDRSRLWEIQTPQVIQKELLKQGFAHAIANDLKVTDDVSLVEALGHPVKIVQGEYSNIKLTTPDDFALAQTLLKRTLTTTLST